MPNPQPLALCAPRPLAPQLRGADKQLDDQTTGGARVRKEINRTNDSRNSPTAGIAATWATAGVESTGGCPLSALPSKPILMQMSQTWCGRPPPWSDGVAGEGGISADKALKEALSAISDARTTSVPICANETTSCSPSANSARTPKKRWRYRNHRIPERLQNPAEHFQYDFVLKLGRKQAGAVKRFRRYDRQPYLMRPIPTST